MSEKKYEVGKYVIIKYDHPIRFMLDRVFRIEKDLGWCYELSYPNGMGKTHYRHEAILASFDTLEEAERVVQVYRNYEELATALDNQTKAIISDMKQVFCNQFINRKLPC